MAPHGLASLVKAHGGYILDYEEDGLLVFDEEGTDVCHLPAPAWDSLSTDHARELAAFFENPGRREKEAVGSMPEGGEASAAQATRLRLVVCHADVNVLHCTEAKQGLLHLVCSAPRDVRIVLSFHAPQQPATPSWKEVFGEIVTKLGDRRSRGNVVFSLKTPFAECSEEEKAFLWGNGFHLSYVHQVDPAGPWFPEDTREAVTGLAEFGFRIPFVWYVDARNVGIVADLIDEAMEINYNSGFALPPVSERPFTTASPLPDIDDYLQLLVDVHERYAHYDEVLAPLDSLVAQTLPRSRSRRSTSAYVWLSPGRPLLVSRIALEDAAPWLTWEEALAGHDPLGMLLQETYRNPFCESCECRVFCPGKCSPAPGREPRQLFYCRTAIFFLKAFAWQRWLVSKTSGSAP